MTITISKEALFGLLNSHSKLSQAEYNRNPQYNNRHYSFIAEENITNELQENNELDNFFAYMNEN